MNRTIVTLSAALTLLAAASCCCCGNEWSAWFTPTPVPQPTAYPAPTSVPEPTSPPATPQSTPTSLEESTPFPTQLPPDEDALETERLLETTDIPARDIHDLAIRLLGVPADTPRTINPGGSPDYPVGTRRVFHVSNVDTFEQFDVTAVLVYKTAHVYMWIEEGIDFDQRDVKEAADLFEERTYPTNRKYFGSEWTPGVDNDPHVSILHTHNLGFFTAGYYSSADEFVSAVRPDSNQMEMFYINMDYEVINSDFYNGVLAHEFQHMIGWNTDRNEDSWVGEGFSELAFLVNGLETDGNEYSFATQPDTQLNAWEEDEDSIPHYGAGFLFVTYFMERFGTPAVQALASHPENGLPAVDTILADLGSGMNHVDLFADWIVANVLNDCSVAGGRYCYRQIDAPYFSIETTYDGSDYPVSENSRVHQYATDYIELNGGRPLTFRFAGATQVGLMDTAAHSGRYLWWSNRADDSDMTLTRAFDLSGVSNATLEYWVWYDIEEDWDYAYVEVSTDGGQTWTILQTPSGTATNPNGNSFGWGYTGRSGGRHQGWIQERVDLSPYAGQRVLVRFEYVTDDALNYPGLALDDVAIPEIGYTSDFEAGDDGWEAVGFIRHANVLPQRWLLQLILFGDETTVQRLELNDDQTGEWTIPLGGDARRAIVTISGLAPVTTEWALYRYEILEQ